MTSLSDGLVGLLFGSGGALTPRDLNRPGAVHISGGVGEGLVGRQDEVGRGGTVGSETGGWKGGGGWRVLEEVQREVGEGGEGDWRIGGGWGGILVHGARKEMGVVTNRQRAKWTVKTT